MGRGSGFRLRVSRAKGCLGKFRVNRGLGFRGFMGAATRGVSGLRVWASWVFGSRI